MHFSYQASPAHNSCFNTHVLTTLCLFVYSSYLSDRFTAVKIGTSREHFSRYGISWTHTLSYTSSAFLLQKRKNNCVHFNSHTLRCTTWPCPNLCNPSPLVRKTRKIPQQFFFLDQLNQRQLKMCLDQEVSRCPKQDGQSRIAHLHWYHAEAGMLQDPAAAGPTVTRGKESKERHPQKPRAVSWALRASVRDGLPLP